MHDFVPPPFEDIASVVNQQTNESRAAFAAEQIRKMRTGPMPEVKPVARVNKAGRDRAIEWALGEKRIEKPDGSVWYKAPTGWMGAVREATHVFLVEHDWGAAFAGAGDIDGNTEWHLPFANCAFEFQVSGMRMILIMAESEKTGAAEAVGLLLRFGDEWTAAVDAELRSTPARENGEKYISAGMDVLYARLINIARCMSIALDAEVVVREMIRAPHRLNSIREKQGKTLLNDYHVVNVAKRSQVEPLPSGGERHEARWHPRMHFRRGHWRHFHTHKTWIKWMLVGNPDLGFIDKHYRA